MKQRIPCLCDNAFTVDLPQEIDLDREGRYLEEILDGSFMNFRCPSCGKLHKPEFAVRLSWPSRNIQLELIPELERSGFLRRESKKGPRGMFGGGKKKHNAADPAEAGKADPRVETVIGYPELLDRIAVFRDGLDSTAVEAVKYFLLLKAEDSRLEHPPGAEMPGREAPVPPGRGELRVWYRGKRPAGDSGGAGEILEFHLEGLREGELAVSRIPLSLYEKTLEESRGGKKNNPPYRGLCVGTYISARNMFSPTPSWPAGGLTGFNEG
jgi:hypothetical protein